MSTSFTTHNAPLYKHLGRSQIEAGRPEDALNAFAAVIQQDPADIEALIGLGDCYLAQGNLTLAYAMFAQARTAGANDQQIGSRLGPSTAAAPAPVPTEPGAVADLLGAMTRQPQPLSEEEVNRAAAMLTEIITSPSPAAAVAAHLNDLDALIPNLIELNIRQARADGRPDLAEALQHLLDHICLQLGLPTAPPPAGSARLEPTPAALPIQLVDGAPDGSSAFVSQLQAAGCVVAASSAEVSGALLIARSPHADPAVFADLRRRVERGQILLLHLEADCEHLPADHPRFAQLALTTPAKREAYYGALQLAETISVSSQAMAEVLRAAGYNAHWLPPGWDRSNPAWEAPASPRTTLNLGWVGSAGQSDDLADLRRPLQRLIREFPQVRLVILDNPLAYRLFDAWPDHQRQYLPVLNQDELPFALSHVDIVLAPAQDSHFMHTQSDQRLLEAGARRLPWVAAPLPAYRAWQTGGLFASSRDEWYAALRQLINDRDLRVSLGLSGRLRAQEREFRQGGQAWRALIEKMLHAPQRATRVKAARPSPSGAADALLLPNSGLRLSQQGLAL